VRILFAEKLLDFLLFLFGGFVEKLKRFLKFFGTIIGIHRHISLPFLLQV